MPARTQADGTPAAEPLPYRYEYLRQLEAEWKKEEERVRGLSFAKRVCERFKQTFRPWSPCEGREHVERLLAKRSDNTSQSWAACSVDWEDAEPLLKLLGCSLDWPNHRFLPDDPLASVFLPSVNEFAPLEFIYAAKREVGSALEDTDLRAFVEADATLEMLVATLLEP